MTWRIAALLLLALSGCASSPVNSMTVSQLLSAPEKVDGESVAVCGWFIADMETCTLQDRPPDIPWNGVDGAIWVLPSQDVCVPVRVFKRPIAGWARVDGSFRVGEGLGHLGLYRYALVGGTVHLLDRCE